MKFNLLTYGAIMLALVAGCKMDGTDNSTANGTNTSAPKANTESSKAPTKTSDLKDDVRNAFKKFRDVPFATVASFDDGNKSKVTVEQYSAADSSFSRKAKDGESTEVIIFGPDQFWRTNSNWEWSKDTSSDDTAAERFFGNFDWIAEKYLPETEVKTENEETINGKPAKVFKLSLGKPSPEVPTSIRIWIDKDRGLPVKIAKERDGMRDLIEEIDLDATVKITKPTVGKK